MWVCQSRHGGRDSGRLAHLSAVASYACRPAVTGLSVDSRPLWPTAAARLLCHGPSRSPANVPCALPLLAQFVTYLPHRLVMPGRQHVEARGLTLRGERGELTRAEAEGGSVPRRAASLKWHASMLPEAVLYLPMLPRYGSLCLPPTRARYAATWRVRRSLGKVTAQQTCAPCSSSAPSAQARWALADGSRRLNARHFVRVHAR